MITSRYISGVHIPVFDASVTEAIEYEIDGGGNTMIIGIENFERRVYRIVEATGMGAFMHAVNELLDLGLVDALADSAHGDGKFDCRFFPTEEMAFEATATESVWPDAASDILAAMPDFAELTETERESLVKSRVGQGLFRDRLVKYWSVCAVTGATCTALLRASHIQPWAKSNNAQRLDQFNGLLLVPNLDAAFDTGYVSFDTNGKILLSVAVTGEPAYALHISPKMKVNPKLLVDEHRTYLEFHRSHVFRG